MSEPSQAIDLQSAAINFEGVVSLDTNDAGVMPMRIPAHERELFHPQVVARASCGAGVRLTMITDSSSLQLDAVVESDDEPFPIAFDLVVDGQFVERRTITLPGDVVRFDGLPEGEHAVEIWLPQFYLPLRYTRLLVDAGATVKPLRRRRPRWVAYGSSITQCRQADGPTTTWPAIIARQFDLDLVCLGYGGNCHLEPMVARMIRDLPADYISLCMGINVHGGATLTHRTFREAVIGLVMIIREKHPVTPLVCMSPIISPPRENHAGGNGLKLTEMRDRIEHVVELMKTRGDDNIHYVNGLDVMGPDDADHLPDDLHPDARGYKVMAERYARVVMPKFGLAAPVAP